MARSCPAQTASWSTPEPSMRRRDSRRSRRVGPTDSGWAARRQQLAIPRSGRHQAPESRLAGTRPVTPNQATAARPRIGALIHSPRTANPQVSAPRNPLGAERVPSQAGRHAVRPSRMKAMEDHPHLESARHVRTTSAALPTSGREDPYTTRRHAIEVSLLANRPCHR
jgi:hypothetical protein